MKTKQLTTNSLMIALNVMLCIVTPIRLANFKFTFEAFPILVSAILYGPASGATVGFFGSFLYQLLFSGYGITATTLLWVLPHAASGLLVGYYSKKHDLKLTSAQTVFICIISALTVTALNTLALYVDSKVYGYYSKALVFASIPVKIAAGAMLAVIYSLVIPKLTSILKTIK